MYTAHKQQQRTSTTYAASAHTVLTATTFAASTALSAFKVLNGHKGGHGR